MTKKEVAEHDKNSVISNVAADIKKPPPFITTGAVHFSIGGLFPASFFDFYVDSIGIILV